MKGGYVYTIIFMLVITIVLTSALALANRGFAPLIESNAALAEKRALLDAFGLDVTGNQQADEALFQENIRTATNNRGQDLYVRLDEASEIIGMAAPFTGAGLWGQIRGYLALSPDGSKLLGIVFTVQNETPGLGGRIDEKQYRDQFRGIAIKAGQPLAYGAPGYEELDAISGATSSSQAVLTIVNQFIEETLPGINNGLEVIP
jgi:Na+-transporting NADH:ubiquinone oxidoreductase subunit C